QFRIRPRDVEFSRPIQVNAAGRRRGERAMPQVGEIPAPLVAFDRVLENLLGLHIHETQPHRTMPENPLEVSHTAASAEALLGIECDYAMAGFPNPLAPGITAKAEAGAQRPNASYLVKLRVSRRETGSQRVGVVEDHDCSGRKCAGEQSA